MQTTPLDIAADVIRKGGIVAYPTESVYGLGCDPRQLATIHRLLEIKQRAIEKGFILIAADVAQLQPYLGPVDAGVMQKVLATWPGPVTWLLPAADNVSPGVRGTHKAIAVRVTAHPIAAVLCRAADTALISTSANAEGHAPLCDAAAVAAMFGSAIDYVLAGDVGGATKPTEIRDALTDAIVRPG
jgi:L-threonylcarbamoyladenylate synthase